MNLSKYKFGGIKALRKFGGEWKAVQINFGTYEYHGLLLNDQYTIKSFAHFTPLFDGDDDSFTTLWHVYKNNKEVLWPTQDPIFILKCFFDGS